WNPESPIPAPQGIAATARASPPGSSFPFPSPSRCSAAGSSPVIHDIDRIGVRDLSKEKESRACCEEDGKHCQGLEPFRQVRGEIESAGREETTAEEGDAQD